MPPRRGSTDNNCVYVDEVDGDAGGDAGKATVVTFDFSSAKGGDETDGVPEPVVVALDGEVSVIASVATAIVAATNAVLSSLAFALPTSTLAPETSIALPNDEGDDVVADGVVG